MVNINDMKTELVDFNSVDILELIFDRQKQLMEKYKTEPVWKTINSVEAQWLIRRFTKYTLEEIGEAFEEVEKRLWYEVNNSNFLNYELRTKTFNSSPFKKFLTKDEQDHLYEEIADSLHFYVEKLLISNVSDPDILYQYIEEYIKEKTWVEETIMSYQDLEKAVLKYSLPSFEEKNKEWYSIGDVYQAIWTFNTYINVADNFLRSKEWQKDQKQVYIEWYQKALAVSLYYYVILLLVLGIDTETITDLYLRKHKVNQFRINSNY